eukprot:TRINITY_DN62953_c0_g1_i1.p1 TRINITY_DN62953_c0_g1~~TRINITY_DN62953_c0_g1_i1.p1  ORF type:complete len:239 (+),score=48.34 TRINITY_DN62953_c0_g1_i1:282-998(+)
MDRAGVAPLAEGSTDRGCLVLVREICTAHADALIFSGVMGYEGHLLMISDMDEKRRQITMSVRQLVMTARELDRHGHGCKIVSCGGTGSIDHAAAVDGVTEIQASGGMFSDLLIRRGFGMAALEYAMFVLATVTSRPTPRRVIVDSGRKSLVHWEILDLPEVVEGEWVGRLEMKALCAEHGVMEVVNPDRDAGPEIGDKIQLVPGYHDLTTCLHEEIVWVKNGKVVETMPTDARGKLH